ncbi:MAG: YceI family protein [Deltaproteobacteria bacterium]|nr:YceI family protein [Deltaproteobacteria bacterium]
MKHVTLALFIVVSLTLGANAMAAWTRAAGVAEAVFHGSGPGGFKIEGKSQKLDVKDDGTSITVSVDLTGLATGITLRDRHMRDKYLEVAKFPLATLVVPVASLKVPATGAIEGDAKGQFTLHGVTKELPFHYKGTCKADGLCMVDGTLDMNMNEFGVNVPSYLGVTVKPNISTSVHFLAKRP